MTTARSTKEIGRGEILRQRSDVLVAVLLCAVTMVVYWPVTHYGFVDFDDPVYVAGNWHVQAGLSWDGVAWAFKSGLGGNWHPCTWLSYMLDVTIFGNKADGHHLMNLLLLVANTLLLFAVLKQMTGSLWRSAFVAGCFALHPLRVESVAWIAERKDVLSAFFFLLTLWAYAGYVSASKAPGAKSKFLFAVSLGLFALGLMSKPMLVTLPFVLLLLDFWPLQRIQISPANFHLPTVSRLIWEKSPFFALSAVVCVVTVFTQRTSGAIPALASVTLPTRIANAVVSYFSYVQKMFWPTDLALLYPYPKSCPLWQIVGAGLFLLVVTLMVVRMARRSPYWVTGWFWYLGTLVPVIGLVQVGNQAMADRYSYIPLIGLGLGLSWSAGTAAGRWPAIRVWLATIGALTLVVCAVRTRVQIGLWSDTEKLFQHTVSVTRDNYVFYSNLGAALYNRGRSAEAMEHFRTSLRINPNYAEAHNHLAGALAAQGDLATAVDHLSQALKANPRYAEAHNNLGNVLLGQGDIAGAREHLRAALQFKPGYPDAHYNLGILLTKEGKWDEAMAEYREALRLKPDFATAHNNLGNLLLRQGKAREAVGHYTAAVRINPGYFQGHENLGRALAQLGEFEAAARHFNLAGQNGADAAVVLVNLGKVRSAQGNTRAAIEHYREALQRRPEQTEALNNLAWILATHREAQFQDSTQSVKLAEQAVALTGNRDAGTLDTLGAAYAAAGRFADAERTARQAQEIATAAGQKELAAQIGARLKSYQAGQPWREP